MKKTCVVFMLLLLLAGCSGGNKELERGMLLRSKILKAEQISFTADIAADYGDKLTLFSMDCRTDANGDMMFTVTAPETIAGITGRISQGAGKLTFDDTALNFELLTDDQLSPVSAPWILMKTLRSGYLTSAGMEEEQLRLTINDSYEDDALQLDIWLDEKEVPQCAEVCYDGRRILTVTVKEFQIL